MTPQPVLAPSTMPKRKIRVLINGIHARSGGGVTYLLNMLPALAEHSDIEFHLFLHAEQYGTISDIDDRIRVHLFDMKTGIVYLLFWEQTCLPILARLMRADLTFSPANYGPLLAPGPIILLRNALSVVGRETRPLKRLYWLALSLMTLLSLSFSRHALAVSNFALKTLTFGFDRFLRGRLSIVYHGVSTLYSPTPTGDTHPPFLLAVADIYIQKNLHTLLDAMPTILKGFPTVKLIIAGRKIDNGYFEELMERVHRLHLNESVEFIGSVPPTQLVDLYRRCTLFVFPSTVETFGNPLVEAMACGVPIACSNTAVMPEIVGDCAEFFDPSNATDIAGSVLRLLSDPNHRKELGQRGVNRAARFSWQESAQRLTDVFRRSALLAP